MTTPYSAELLARIQEKCQRQRYWFGDHLDSPYWHPKDPNEQWKFPFSWYNDQGQEYLITQKAELPTISEITGFAYPPATQKQLRATEVALGFALPTLLRDIYTQLANGGFGPGLGLSGTLGGAGSMVDNYRWMNWQARTVDITDFEHKITAEQYIPVAYYVWPERFIELCDWGCATYSYLDVVHNRVFRGGLLRFDGTYGFRPEAPSLEAWFSLWLDQES